MQYIEKQSTHWLSDFLAISRERSDLSSHEAGFYVCLISRIWTIKSQIGRVWFSQRMQRYREVRKSTGFF